MNLLSSRMFMRALLVFVWLMGAGVPAWAQSVDTVEVTFYAADFAGVAQNRTLTITPTSTPIVQGGTIVQGGPVTVTPSAGVAAVSLVPHSYRVTWAGLSSPLTILVGDTNSAVNAASIVVVSTNTVSPNAGYAWSIAVSDERYALAGEAGGGGVTNGQFYLSFPHLSVGTPGDVGEVTNYLSAQTFFANHIAANGEDFVVFDSPPHGDGSMWTNLPVMVAAGSNVTLTTNANNLVTINASGGGGTWWDVDGNGDLMPALSISGSDPHWELDGNGDLQPQ